MAAEVSGPTLSKSSWNFSSACFARINQFPQRDNQCSVRTLSNDHVSTGVSNPFLTQFMEKAKIVKAGFVDSALGAQSEVPLKRFGTWTAFFEHIRKGPVDRASTLPSHSRMVLASAGPTKEVSRASSIPGTFHSVQNNGRRGIEELSESACFTFETARQTRSSVGISRSCRKDLQPYRRRTRDWKQNPRAHDARRSTSGNRLPTQLRQWPDYPTAAAHSPLSEHAPCAHKDQSNSACGEFHPKSRMRCVSQTSKYHCATSSMQ